MSIGTNAIGALATTVVNVVQEDALEKARQAARAARYVEAEAWAAIALAEAARAGLYRPPVQGPYYAPPAYPVYTINTTAPGGSYEREDRNAVVSGTHRVEAGSGTVEAGHYYTGLDGTCALCDELHT